jgi:HPr kinase/phosphorylase
MFGRGILMKGDSGIGKTTLAMKLVQRGHVWVADYAIEIEKGN